jgi:hypothetical protein
MIIGASRSIGHLGLKADRKRERGDSSLAESLLYGAVGQTRETTAKKSQITTLEEDLCPD